MDEKRLASAKYNVRISLLQENLRSDPRVSFGYRFKGEGFPDQAGIAAP
jgi:hypothetical protein